MRHMYYIIETINSYNNNDSNHLSKSDSSDDEQYVRSCSSSSSWVVVTLSKWKQSVWELISTESVN